MRAKANEIDVMIGLKIETLRKARGMTRQALGMELGITFQQIQKYENGKNRVAANKIALLAEALNTTANDILCVDCDVETVPKSKALLNFMRNFCSLTEGTQDQVKSLVKILSTKNA